MFDCSRVVTGSGVDESHVREDLGRFSNALRFQPGVVTSIPLGGDAKGGPLTENSSRASSNLSASYATKAEAQISSSALRDIPTVPSWCDKFSVVGD